MTKSQDQSKKKPLHQLVAELDKQYLATRKEWKKPSATFAGHEDRFAMAVPVAPAPYNPMNGTISDSVARAKKVHSPWAEDVSPQRPRVPSPVCNGDYSPHSQSSLNQSARSAFASQTPKLLEPQSTTPPPGAYNAASPSPSKSRPSAAMVSKSPRFSDPVVWTKTSYNTEVGTVNYDLQKAKKVPSPWSKTRDPQRPAAAKVVDASYDVKLPGSTPTTARAAFKSAAQRFVEEKPQAPPVGTYTSPLISCGMLS